MKLKDYRETFYTYSGKASDLSRQLALAGIAFIWLFKKDSAGQLSIPQDLFAPGILIVAALALDLIHYCLGALIWRLFYRGKEKANVGEDADFEHSTLLEIPLWVIFCLKIACVLAAYGYLFAFFWRAVSFK